MWTEIFNDPVIIAAALVLLCLAVIDAWTEPHD